MKNKDDFLQIKNEKLIDWDGPDGCFASNKITKEGYKVGYMYRETGDNNADSGWRFLAGDESDEYVNNPENMNIFSLNTICNYDPDIIPYLKSEENTSYIRVDDKTFKKDNGQDKIYVTK